MPLLGFQQLSWYKLSATTKQYLQPHNHQNWLRRVVRLNSFVFYSLYYATLDAHGLNESFLSLLPGKEGKKNWNISWQRNTTGLEVKLDRKSLLSITCWINRIFNYNEILFVLFIFLIHFFQERLWYFLSTFTCIFSLVL